MKVWQFLIFGLLLTMALALATFPIVAQTPTPTGLQVSGVTPGAVDLISRSAYREIHTATEGDISRSGTVITMLAPDLSIKVGTPPVESSQTIEPQYLFSIGCTQQIECTLADYDLAAEGGVVFMVIKVHVGEFDYLPLLVRQTIGGDAALWLQLAISDSVLDITSAGNGDSIAWVNQRQSQDVTEIYWYEGDTPILVTHDLHNEEMPADGDSSLPSLSTDGQWMAFQSYANNLVANDSKNSDIFLYSAETERLEKISVGMNGSVPNGDSYDPFIESTGRFVVFVSDASNLVPNDSNGQSDIFIYDRTFQTIRRVSIAGNGQEANGPSSQPSISENGSAIAFISSATNLVTGDTNDSDDVFIHSRLTGQTRRASVTTTGQEAIGTTTTAQISADGGYVLFSTLASLEARDTGGNDLYVNAPSGQTYRVNYKPLSITPNKATQLVRDGVSADGRYILFNSAANNLLASPPPIPNEEQGYLYEYDRQRRLATRIELPVPDMGGAVAASKNGRFVIYVVFEGGSFRLFRYDRENGVSALINSRADGTEIPIEYSWVALSDDGRYVVLSAVAPTWVPGASANCQNPNYCRLVYLKDMTDGTVTHITIASDGTPANMSVPEAGVVVSDDGEWVAFVADADNLVANDGNYLRDVFVHNTITEETRRVSVSNEGVEGNGDSGMPLSFSNDGRYLMFSSRADNLVADDQNGDVYDSFIYDLTEETVTIIALPEEGTTVFIGSGGGLLSGDGRTVAFNTSAPLLDSDQDEEVDLYLQDWTTGDTWLATVPYGPSELPLEGGGSAPSLSDDGTVVAFTHERLTFLDFNNTEDLYVFDRTTPPFSHQLFLPSLRY